MRSNIICSLAAALAVFVQFSAIFATFSQPVASIARQPTHMSFSVKGEERDFEFSGTPRGLFCQPGNLASPLFARMIVDLLRFNRALRRLLEHEESGESMHDFLARHRFSRAFIERLIVPQLSAVWSADPRKAGSAFAGVMAASLANGGSPDDIMPGIQFFADLKKEGNFVPLPSGMLFMNRLQFGFYSVLARLDVEVDYAAVEREFMAGVTTE